VVNLIASSGRVASWQLCGGTAKPRVFRGTDGLLVAFGGETEAEWRWAVLPDFSVARDN